MKDYMYLEKILKFERRFERWFKIRPRSRKEIQDYLRFKLKIADVDFEEFASEVSLYFHQSDEEFADWYIYQRTHYSRYGRRRIDMELKQKGVDRDLIEEIWKKQGEDNFLDDVEEEKLGLRLEKNLRKYKEGQEVLDNSAKQKIIQKFIRAGYNYKKIVDLIEIYLEN